MSRKLKCRKKEKETFCICYFKITCGWGKGPRNVRLSVFLRFFRAASSFMGIWTTRGNGESRAASEDGWCARSVWWEVKDAVLCIDPHWDAMLHHTNSEVLLWQQKATAAWGGFCFCCADLVLADKPERCSTSQWAGNSFVGAEYQLMWTVTFFRKKMVGTSPVIRQFSEHKGEAASWLSEWKAFLCTLA